MNHRIENIEKAVPARIAASREAPEAQRVVRIARIRCELEAGTYESALKLNCAVDRLLTALNLADCAQTRPKLCIRYRRRCSTLTL